ncbi:hypothetical protein [Neokomagataea thailandica]|uniref:Uncharacterized protein n=1 Tax=Neokomagataea tanensis NBRC 106556 TaxID=1223519 RepID=A0ABQ0QLQ5_9PROT|nr:MULTISPECIES: hypothetical protein [Neokomagataea]GBR49597.1 hypothetical protein AA106556_2099 [Neokomagataea tanensis NBRC 106556]
MTKIPQGHFMLAASAECGEEVWSRSLLFRWMVLHYDTLKTQIVGKRVRWKKMCEAAIKDGLTTRNGTPPKEETVRKTWYRVRLKMEREAREREAELAERRRKRDEDTARRQALQIKAHEVLERTRPKEDMSLIPPAPDVPYERPTHLQNKPEAPHQSVLQASVSTPSVQVSDQQPVVSSGSATHHIDVLNSAQPPVQMMKQAFLYGVKIEIPPPYEGPRPLGMPEYLPLEALTPLNYPVYDAKGRINVELLPGFPRRSFFEDDRTWARAFKEMLDVYPPKERSNVMRCVYSAVQLKAR